MSRSKDALIVLFKYPELGKVKTRLAAAVGNVKALSIYNKLLNYTIQLSKNFDGDTYYFYSGEKNLELPTKNLIQQTEGNLGDKMRSAFEFCFENGYENVLIIGTDCPGITEQSFEQATLALNYFDVVIGPANDGGYYLMGMKKMIPELFTKISWSTPTVLNETTDRLSQINLKHLLLEQKIDIDTIEDLREAGLFKWLE